MSFSGGILTAFALTCPPIRPRTSIFVPQFTALLPLLLASLPAAEGNGANHERSKLLKTHLRRAAETDPFPGAPEEVRMERLRPADPSRECLDSAALAAPRPPDGTCRVLAVGRRSRGVLLLVYGRPETFSAASRRPRPTPGRSKKADCVSDGPHERLNGPAKA